MLILTTVVWTLAAMPSWSDNPSAMALDRSAAMREMMKPFDTGLTFPTEEECQLYVNKATDAGKQNISDILTKRGLPAFQVGGPIDSNFACTKR